MNHTVYGLVLKNIDQRFFNLALTVRHGYHMQDVQLSRAKTGQRRLKEKDEMIYFDSWH